MEWAAAAAAANPISKKITELRTACRRKIRTRKERSELAASSFRDLLRSSKSKAEENLENREEPGKLKDYHRRLEDDLGDVLEVARIEQLEKQVQEQRARKDKYAAVISEQLHILKALEEKSKENMREMEDIEEVIMWYRRILGFRTEGGEGVKFIFNNIDLKNPDEEYTFTVRLNGDIYYLMNCDPDVEDVNELIKDLNKTNDLFKFVRIMREIFQAAARNGALPKSFSPIAASSPMTASSPPPVSQDSRSETSIKENVPHFRSTKARLRFHHSPMHGQVAASSPQSISNLRRSPRFVNKQVP